MSSITRMVKKMEIPASLVLEDGSVFEGYAFGAIQPSLGELVFNTSMTGYQEILTDPSYAGQIVMPTYPLIGNYGINARDFESRRVQVSGFVVREHCLRPSHSMSTSSIDQFLLDQKKRLYYLYHQYILLIPSDREEKPNRKNNEQNHTDFVSSMINSLCI